MTWLGEHTAQLQLTRNYCRFECTAEAPVAVAAAATVAAVVVAAAVEVAVAVVASEKKIQQIYWAM